MNIAEVLRLLTDTSIESNLHALELAAALNKAGGKGA